MLEEGVHGPRDQVAGRLVAGHGEEEEEQLELELRELVAVDLDVDEDAHEVVGGVGLLLGEKLGRVGEELDGRRLGVVLAVGIGLELGVLLPDHAVGPVEHVVAVLGGTPRRSAMTCSGSSAEMSVTKSAWPFSMTASMMSSAVVVDRLARGRSPCGG